MKMISSSNTKYHRKYQYQYRLEQERRKNSEKKSICLKKLCVNFFISFSFFKKSNENFVSERNRTSYMKERWKIGVWFPLWIFIFIWIKRNLHKNANQAAYWPYYQTIPVCHPTLHILHAHWKCVTQVRPSNKTNYLWFLEIANSIDNIVKSQILFDFFRVSFEIFEFILTSWPHTWLNNMILVFFFFVCALVILWWL